MWIKAPPIEAKRRRMSQRMTLIVGAFCANAMVFCSDTEEGTAGGGKRNVKKLFHYAGSDWDMIVGTAGFGPLCDVAAKQIEQVCNSDPEFIDSHNEHLSKIVASLHQQYISEQKRYERQIQLVIGIFDRSKSERYLYLTVEEILQPIQHPFTCAGVGQEIAFYLLDRLYDDSLNYAEVNDLFAFVMREAKDSVGSVGGNTEIFAVTTDNKGIVHSRFAPGWEAKQPRLADVMPKFWRK